MTIHVAFDREDRRSPGGRHPDAASETLHIDWRYGLLTVAYLAGIFSLSALPGLSSGWRHSFVETLMNLGHAPLFAGLAFCMVKSLSGMHEWSRYAFTAAVSGICAALDEWHQSFVPGRHVSIADFLLDLAGIIGMLAFLRLLAARSARRSAGPRSSAPLAALGKH